MTQEEIITEFEAAANYSYSDDAKSLIVSAMEWADLHPKTLLSAADRGTIDEIIKALNFLAEEHLISYQKEINFLFKIRKL